MRRVGKSGYILYWPKTSKDECLYPMEDVFDVIPEPTLIKETYQLEERQLNSVTGRV